MQIIPVVAGQKVSAVRRENELGYDVSIVRFSQRESDDGGFLKVSEYSTEAASALKEHGIDESNVIAIFEIF